MLLICILFLASYNNYLNITRTVIDISFKLGQIMDLLSLLKYLIQTLSHYNSIRKNKICIQFIIFKMQKNPGHQPQRFEVYVELPNGMGFTLKDTKHIFYYDKYGGWKDEYGNYYNADGKADEEPDSNSQKSYSEGSWSESDIDEYEKDFGPSADVQDAFQNQPVQSQEQLTIAQNIAELQHHIKDQPLRVNFEILDLEEQEETPTPKQLLHMYRKKVKGIINVFYDFDEHGQLSTGYFVVRNVHQAQKLIHLEGQNVVGHDLSFDVEKFDELRADPLSQKQLENTLPEFVSLGNDEKLYVLGLESGGFNCEKKVFLNWSKSLGLTKFDIVKIIRAENKQRKPVVKILSQQLQKLKQAEFEGKKVTIQQYTAKTKAEQEQKTQQTKKEQAAQKKQQKKEQQSQQTKAQSQQPVKSEEPKQTQ